jgi:hypothetical protein
MNHTINSFAIISGVVLAFLYCGSSNPSGSDPVDDGRQMVYTVPFDAGDSIETVTILAQTIDADSVIIPTNNIDTLHKYRLIVFVDYHAHEVRVARYYVEGFHIYDIMLEFKP